MSSLIVDQTYDFFLKIVVIGDSGVGKTNLLSRFVENQFSIESKPTIGVEFGTKTVAFENHKIKVQLWDTAGKQKFRAISHAYYKGAAGALIVFDLTRRSTFQNIAKWLKEMKQNTAQNIVSILIGNKSDMPQGREVKLQQIEKFAQQNNLGYFETSAKENINVVQAVLRLLSNNVNKKTQQKQQKKEPKIQNKPNLEGVAFLNHLKSQGFKDEAMNILCSQEINSLTDLRQCTQQALVAIGLKLGQVIKLKKL